MAAEDQEYQFRGSINLTTDDCIIDTVAQAKEEPWSFGKDALDAKFQGEN